MVRRALVGRQRPRPPQSPAGRQGGGGEGTFGGSTGGAPSEKAATLAAGAVSVGGAAFRPAGEGVAGAATAWMPTAVDQWDLRGRPPRCLVWHRQWHTNKRWVRSERSKKTKERQPKIQEGSDTTHMYLQTHGTAGGEKRLHTKHGAHHSPNGGHR